MRALGATLCANLCNLRKNKQLSRHTREQCLFYTRTYLIQVSRQACLATKCAGALVTSANDEKYKTEKNEILNLLVTTSAYRQSSLATSQRWAVRLCRWNSLSSLRCRQQTTHTQRATNIKMRLLVNDGTQQNKIVPQQWWKTVLEQIHQRC